jgi:lysophospholipase L1-like esterase
MILPRGTPRRAACAVAVAALMAGAGLALSGLQPRAAASSGGWVATWAASPMAPTPLQPNLAIRGFADQTVRDIVFTSVGGRRVRIRLSNTFGARPLRIGQASVGVVQDGAGLLPGTIQPVLFDGRTSVTVRAGAEVVSDPVPLPVSPMEKLAVSIYLPDATGPATYHEYAQQVNYVAAGDHAGDASPATFTTRAPSWYFLDAVEVTAASRSGGSVVAFGDSITDGLGSTVGADDRWPDDLARRLDAAFGSQAPGVVDEGIGGNRILHGSACYGPSGLARFGRDVLEQAGVRDVIVLEGINDIGFSRGPDTGCEAPDTRVSAAQIIAGYEKLIAAARASRVKIFGGTLTPFRGSFAWTPAAQATWNEVNHWIRTSHAFNGVIDFARALADPGHPEYLNPAYNSGDGLHPNDAGYAAMADAISLALLK